MAGENNTYRSNYFTAEEIDQRLLQGYYDDAVKAGYKGTIDSFKSNLAKIGKLGDELDILKIIDNSSLNNYETDGIYNINTVANEFTELPVSNTGKVSMRLTVLTSTSNNNTVITQVLNLNNNAGGDGNMYIRSCQKGNWKPWAKLQTNVEVGLIDQTKMDGLTDNGIYSGILSTTKETFIIICINNYAIAQQVGVQHISHLKYSLVAVTGEVKIEKRTRDAFGFWSGWTSIKGGGSGGNGVDVEALKTELKLLIDSNKTAITNEVNRAKNAEDKLTKDVEYLRDSTVVYGKKPEILGGAVQSDGSYYSGTPYSVRVNKFNSGTTILLNDGYHFMAVLKRNADDSVAEFIEFSDKPKYYRAEDANSIYELNISKDDGGTFSSSEYANIIAEVTLFGVSYSSGGGGDITATPTEKVINDIEPTLVTNALRKTPQVLTDSEKEIARGNIGAVSYSDLNNAIAEAIINTLNTAV